jgi:hypothetical protein
MSVRLGAPFPLIETYVYLPNPEFGDSEAFSAELDRKRSIDNTLYTYVKSKDGRKKLQMRFRMTRMKMLEFRAFLVAYYRTRITLFDHLEQLWIGWITTNPNEFENSRAIFGRNSTLTGETLADIQIEFEGIKQ